MGTYQYSRLSRDTFEKKWRARFDALFQHSDEGGEVHWIPDQVFAEVAKITMYHPQPYYLREDYHDFEKVLHHLREDEFAVVDKEALDTGSEQVGIVFHLQQHTGGARDLRKYHIEGQPLEFFMFGRCLNWGFVSSEPYNIGILNADRTLLASFIAERPPASEEEIREYLEHTPTLYRSRFEQNYLEH
ncbi:MAG: hypothetical protein GVY25_10045 [Bacteroidetes bacterium]|jgi:glutaredoxin|nr:hypothetical protein [Bacteroidota bacterium]